VATQTAGKPLHRTASGPVIRELTLEQPWSWLARGWADLWRRPGLSLSYGLAVVLASYLLTFCLFQFDVLPLLLPLAAGFMLVGPMLAVGLYEMSRRYETGEPVNAGAVIFVATRSPAQLAFLGALLTLILMAWWRIATLLFALFFGAQGFPPLEAWVGILLFTVDGLVFLAVGSLVGGILAVAVFAVSAIAVPMLMVRETDAVTAMINSARAVMENPWPMLLWAWLIAMLTGFGIVTLYAGLAITFPLVGHATWHAYRDIVGSNSDG
jgi:uncharacterized membrane protein